MISILSIAFTLATAPTSIAELRNLPANEALAQLADSSEASAFLRAEQTLRSGRAQDALVQAESFEMDFPGSTLAFRSRLIEAWSAMSLGDQHRGCQILSEIILGTDRQASQQARATLRDWAKSGKLAAEEMLSLPARLPPGDTLVADLATAFSANFGKPLVVLLPSTGAYAPIGKRVARGALLAAETANVLAIQVDEPSDPILAAQLVRGLLRVVHPRAVVGPLLSNTSSAVAQEMARWAPEVPLLFPAATSPGVSKLAPSAWQVNVTTTQQGIEAARQVKNCLKISEAFLLWPKGDFGDAVSEGFRAEFTRLGGRIGWLRNYTSGNNDFRAQLESLRKISVDLARRRGQDTTKLTPLIFSPGESPSEAAALAGQATAIGMKPHWVGASGWHSRQFLLETVGRMDGALVVTDNVPDESRPEWKTFSQKWKANGSDAPDRLAALGWDAAQLALLGHLPPPTIYSGAQADVQLDSVGRNNTKVPVLLVDKGAFANFSCPAK